jgi:PAS domain-containing protein
VLSDNSIALFLDAFCREAKGMTKHKQTQEVLRTSEIRYRRLFEAARDGILILDAVTLKITDMNPFMTELLAYSRADFLGKELWEIGLFSDKEAQTSRTEARSPQSQRQDCLVEALLRSPIHCGNFPKSDALQQSKLTLQMNGTKRSWLSGMLCTNSLFAWL